MVCSVCDSSLIGAWLPSADCSQQCVVRYQSKFRSLIPRTVSKQKEFVVRRGNTAGESRTRRSHG